MVKPWKRRFYCFSASGLSIIGSKEVNRTKK